MRLIAAALCAAAQCGPADFADLLLVPGVGERTVAQISPPEQVSGWMLARSEIGVILNSSLA